MTKTKLHRINEFDRDEWSEMGINSREYNAMLAAQYSGTEVTVVCEATDGYYDIIIRGDCIVSGGEVKVPAISGYHLVDLALITG